jgi:hypothetical protein
MQKQQQLRDGSNGSNPTGRRPLAVTSPATLSVEALESRCLFSGSSGDVVLHWNELLVQSLPSTPAPVPAFRNMALVHVAIFDAVNAIDRSYEPYAADVKASHGASPEAAAAQAAHDTLAALYPSRQALFDAALAEDLADIRPGPARQGAAVGKEVARQILDLRANDGASTAVGYTPPNSDPGQWQPIPAGSAAGAANVPFITPFAIESNSQFRPGPPPELTSAEYAAAFNETKALGSDVSTVRTDDQTQVARVWETPFRNLAAWNRIAQDVARDRGTNLAETARLFALLDVAINDGLHTSFESKYHYALWRPLTAIHRADEDGNPATEADPSWKTLHAATPPYPTYAGNAATIGAASATVLADVFGGDGVPFTVDWSVYGPQFAGVTRSYDGFWAAADEEAVSRVYGGIHFSFDSVAGQEIGANVGEYVLDNVMLREGGDEDDSVLSRGSSRAPAGPHGSAGSSNSFFDSRDDGHRDSSDGEDEDRSHRSVLR